MPVDPSRLSTAERAGYYLSALAIRGALGLARLVPYRWRIPGIGWLVSRVFAGPAGFRRRIRKNLALTCPDLPAAEVERLVRVVPDNAARSMAELFAGDAFRERTRHSPVSGDGFQAMVEAKANGQPVIFVTGHLGNYDAARVAVRDMGFPMGALYRRMANPYFNEFYAEALAANGSPMFEQGRRGMTEMIRHLKAGGRIAVVTDLFVQGGEDLSFFGVPAITSTATAEMALKYGALLIPAYAIRAEDGLSFTIDVRAPIPHSDAVTMTQAINDDLEAMVRANMDQWFWIHRRWKRPDGSPPPMPQRP
ncbi:lysophospholipid acyltransferase family protein [Chachezhania antarctica]|uniref:lysophospholipid acyltransferase family protein n=1 Tax=Chachezhania antarctica TaxID=2340860 RepID=UPI000EB1AE14|nr:lysophospholipid acyltransferase family protein [Chachezhania antarctica]